MTLNSSIREALVGFLTSLCHLLMPLIVGEDLRAIARSVTRARPGHVVDLKTRWGNRPDPATNLRVE